MIKPHIMAVAETIFKFIFSLLAIMVILFFLAPFLYNRGIEPELFLTQIFQQVKLLTPVFVGWRTLEAWRNPNTGVLKFIKSIGFLKITDEVLEKRRTKSAILTAWAFAGFAFMGVIYQIGKHFTAGTQIELYVEIIFMVVVTLILLVSGYFSSLHKRR